MVSQAQCHPQQLRLESTAPPAPSPRPSYQLCAHRPDHGCGHSLAYPLSPVKRIKGPTVSLRECQPKPTEEDVGLTLPRTSTPRCEPSLLLPPAIKQSQPKEVLTWSKPTWAQA